MRKFQQKKVLELIQTLHEATAEIGRLISQNDFTSVLQVLSGCQEFALSIGTFIESIEGEGTKTVSLLEEYCKDLYDASIALEGGEMIVRFVTILQAKVIQIENSVHHELMPSKIEVAFFPYKASMFDSFESIWLAAKDHPMCDAYVVPIPYFDRMADGSLGSIHYEGNQYPAYVPVTDWRSYNVKERHPDIIFIHSPYDEGNHVSIIHPDFFSKRIKNFTDLLVYVPYFVCADDVPQQYCVCAGTLQAGKVMLQSEKIRETYIQHFRQFENEKNCAGMFGIAQDKFVALGSPKFDKVINSTADDYCLPDAWRKRMTNKDGTQRKAVLYNTSLNAILHGEKQYLIKLRAVLNTFRLRDDVILWWRPHPLSEATYQSMRPQLAMEYKQIIEEYTREGWGIYDDTTDLHRAISLSDAYFGDSSSLVALYQCTDKPVMLQNIFVDTDCNEKRESLAFENLCFDGQDYWFSATNVNSLFKMSTQHWTAEYMGSFLGESTQGRLYSSIVPYEGKLYFAPYAANSIAVYDIKLGSFSKVDIIQDLHASEKRFNEQLKFSFAVSYKEWIFFFPNAYPAIIKYHCATGEVCYLHDCMQVLNQYILDETVYYFRDGCIDGSKVTMYSNLAGALVVFDMDTCMMQVIHRFHSEERCYNLCFDGKHYWLAPFDDQSAILKINPETMEITKITDLPSGFVAGRRPFWLSAYANGYVWMLPGLANQSLKIHVNTNTVQVADEFQAERVLDISNAEQWKFSLLQKNGSKLLAFDNTSCKLVEYDLQTNVIRKEHVSLNRSKVNACKKLWRYILSGQGAVRTKAADYIIRESELFTLNDYLYLMTQPDDHSMRNDIFSGRAALLENEISHFDGTSGKAIMDYCMNEVILS